MTTLNFALAHAVARTLQPGDEIVVTELDHDANVAPWLRVADDHGLVVRTAPVRTGDVTLDVDALEALLGPRTRIVAFTLASNAVGSIPTPGASSPPPTTWARSPGPTPCTSRPTAARIARRSAPTSCSARRTSSSVLTSGSRRSAATSPRRGPPTACGPRPRIRRATASRPGRRRSRRSPASSPRSTTCATSATATLDAAYAAIRAHEEVLCVRVLEGRRRAPRRHAPTASPIRRASRSARRRSASPWPVAARARSPRRSRPTACTSGTATSTRTRSCTRSAWRRTAARCAPGSCTTRPRTRSTGCWPVSRRLS